MTTSAIDNVMKPDDKPDTPIKRKALLEMSLEKIVQHIDMLKTTRFNIDSFVQRARSKNSNLSYERLHNKTELAIKRLDAKSTRINGLIDAAKEDANKIRVLLLEMGELIPGVDNDTGGSDNA